jgi:hypothetical protein
MLKAGAEKRDLNGAQGDAKVIVRGLASRFR